MLHQFFDRQAAIHHTRPALEIPPGHDRPQRIVLTYAELAAASYSIQQQLQQHASHDVVIPILLPRTTPAAFAAQLAILRAGAAYTSIDVSFPDSRIAEILKDAEAPIVVTDARGAARLTSLGWNPARLLDPYEPAEPVGPVGPVGPVESLAYVIYTSGTTGRPKGVMIPHSAISNLVQSDIDEFRLTPDDRVAHGSSHAYDSSLEEIWLAWAAGATVVVMDDEAARAGPDAVTWLDRESISVFCPPPTLLRATGVRPGQAVLPKLRLLYVGGEALPQDVVDTWAPGRRMVNGYGPTECTVVATRADVRAGEPVTIGHPIANNTAHILDGELCIGGAGLARGYHNDPELTARKFIEHPTFGRLYRTGDLARLDSGSLVCLGRADSQVKIRGYRIELEEIDARLEALPGVRHAATRVHGTAGRQAIAAFIVPNNAAAPPAADTLRRELARTLPPYMVPARIGILAALPLTTGGKLDRTRLPELEATALDLARPEILRPSSPMEQRIADALHRVIDRSDEVSIDANFFEDLGGDSLLAAELITALRAHPDTAGLTVRDAYAAPTIAELAARASGRAADGTTRLTPDARASVVRPGGNPAAATIIQTLWLIAELLLISAVAWAGTFVAAPALLSRIPLATALILVPAIWLVLAIAYIPLSVAFVILMKRLIVGRYTERRAPVWGRFYVQHWIVRQLMRIVPWRWLEGTVFQVAALRALGARIGDRVHIHRGVDLLQGGWDLLEIGDDATLGQEAIVRLVDLDDEDIVVGPIVIGRGATVETRASIAPGTRIGHNGYLTALSSLTPGSVIPGGECWDGVPASCIGPAPEPPAITAGGAAISPRLHGALMLLARALTSLTAPLGVTAVTLLSASVVGMAPEDLPSWLVNPGSRWDFTALLLTAAALSVPMGVAIQAAAARLLGRVRPGVISRWSLDYLRVWAKTDLVRRAGDWLSGSLMWPIWLRAAGMEIGRNSEISTIIDVVPELVTIGGETFFADGVYLGGPRVHRGTVALVETSLGRDVFLGNHVVIPAGCHVPDGVLIGVSTVANAQTMRPGSAWFGHPPFALTRPPAPTVDRRLTHEPSLVRRANRWVWELGRFLIPVVPAATAIAFIALILRSTADSSPFEAAVLLLPLFMLGAAVTLCLVVLAMKWLLLGRVRPAQHALWSCWCSRWDFLYVAWGRIARPFLAAFDGTLLLAWYLRAMGMKIGRRVVLGPGFAQVVDPDMIRIDDDATVHALFQAHTFEDRMLKIDRVRIRRRATVGCGAVLFYGVDVGEGASVEPQSVIMKNERLQAGRRYEGSPAGIRTVPSKST